MYIRTIDIWKVVTGLFKSIDGGNEFSLNLFYCTFRNRDDPFFPLVLLTPDPDATAEKLILRRHWSRRLVGGCWRGGKVHRETYRVSSKTVLTWLFALLLASTHANCKSWGVFKKFRKFST